MAVIDASGLMKFKDASGNIYVLYPITNRDNVTGLEYVDEHIADTSNPHETTADQVGAISTMGVRTSGSGTAYTAYIDGLSQLRAGVSFVMIPHTDSTTPTPTLNLNGLGAKTICRRVSSGSSTTTDGGSANWLSANSPVFVTYNGTFWITDLVTPNAVDITGTVPVANGGTGAKTAKGALTNLGITLTADVINGLDDRKVNKSGDTMTGDLTGPSIIGNYMRANNQLKVGKSDDTIQFVMGVKQDTKGVWFDLRESGTMKCGFSLYANGLMNLPGIKLTNSNSNTYGESFPTDNLVKGQLFFKKV